MRYIITSIIAITVITLASIAGVWVAKAPASGHAPSTVIIQRPADITCDGREMQEDEYLNFNGDCIHLDEIVATTN